MKHFDWNVEKNEKLKAERNVTFEEVVFSIIHGGLLDIIVHPDQQKYPGQRIFVINIENYAFLVPFVETEECIFLKTIFPSRKMTRKYLGGETNETR